MSYPATYEVLSGVVYGASDELTGTLVMPTLADIASTVSSLGFASQSSVDAIGTTVASIETTLAGVIDVNVAEISGDSGAADALEAILDGTGAAMYLTRLSIDAGSNSWSPVSITNNEGSYATVSINQQHASNHVILITSQNGSGTGYCVRMDSAGDPIGTLKSNAAWQHTLDISAGIESSWTVRQGLRIMLAALAGKASGLDTGSPAYRDMADSKDRISATTDADGNRSAVTLDAT